MSDNSSDRPPLAIAYPSGNAAGVQQEPVPEGQQPRQPHSLQGLLKFAMEATKDEDARQDTKFVPLDEERKKFLENALKSMTVDILEELRKPIEKLQNANGLPIDFDISEHEAALERIAELVDDVDIANDFHKIGGFTIFPPCFASIHPEIRAGACNILAELCQNNPYCQQVVIDNNMLGTLVDLIKVETNETVLVKAIYAVSCNVRENNQAYHQLRHFRGITILLTNLQKPIDKVRTKCAFLLGVLCRAHPKLKKDLITRTEIFSLLADLIMQERWPSHEHIIELLLAVVEDYPEGIQECGKREYNLKNILLQHCETYKHNEECQEEIATCSTILETVFAYKLVTKSASNAFTQ